MSIGDDSDSGSSSTGAAARWSARRFGGCLLAAVGISVVVGCLGTWALVRADEFAAAAFLPLLLPGITLWLAWGLWQLHRQEDREIERFEQRPSMDPDEFLHAVGIDCSSEFAEIAMAARAKLAELGCVPPESIRDSDRFYPDLEKLPFYDSIDFLEVVLTLEQELGIRIGKDDEAAICESVAKGTVGDVVDHAVRIYRDQHGEKRG